MARRITDVSDPAYDGIATTVPTLDDINVASGGALDLGPGYWRQNYTKKNPPIRQTSQSDEQFAQFGQDHADVSESFAREERMVTLAGNPLLLLINVSRFPNPAVAAEYFGLIPQRTAEANFDARPIDPPQSLMSDVPTQWYDVRIPAPDGEVLGVTGSVQKDSDAESVVIGSLQIFGPPQSPDQNNDPDYNAALSGLAGTLVNGYARLSRDKEDDCAELFSLNMLLQLALYDAIMRLGALTT